MGWLARKSYLATLEAVSRRLGEGADFEHQVGAAGFNLCVADVDLRRPEGPYQATVAAVSNYEFALFARAGLAKGRAQQGDVRIPFAEITSVQVSGPQAGSQDYNAATNYLRNLMKVQLTTPGQRSVLVDTLRFGRLDMRMSVKQIGAASGWGLVTRLDRRLNGDYRNI